MKKITEISGKTIPLRMSDVDTDLIIPAQYLTSVTKAGFGEHLFQRLRDSDPKFVFNQPQFSGASILIAEENFGCGSSREHAVWALQEAGIQCVIAISFADIFSSNSGKNNLLLLTLPEGFVSHMLTASEMGDYQLTIDIVNKSILSSTGETYSFDMDPFRHHCFINGLGDFDYLLSHKKEIDSYMQKKADRGT